MFLVFEELKQMWEGTDQKAVDDFIDLMCASRSRVIVGLGAGRMGYAIQSFVMRVSHLGYRSYMIGDTTLPRVDEDTIVVVNTSSGETPSIKLYVEQCKDANCHIVVLTAGVNSSIAALADLVITMPKLGSDQLMKTAYEQYTFILLDHIAQSVFLKSNLDRAWVEQNHSILE
jgi:6-phospho-3-hexuloisomerase